MSAITPERWQRISAVFNEARAQAGAQRAAYLSAACASDDALRAEVDGLLAQDGHGTEVLQGPVANEAADGSVRHTLLGRTVGVYEIRGFIGAGGMGEVYRAHDRQLRRDVALKILPSQVATDAERVARFEREARMLAALNHQNIAVLYGFERSDGVDALVLELVDGPTLDEYLGSKPLPPRTAVQIARQIAEALRAAHEQNIVHRDLKPANVKVTPAGMVKVLDFGLAKPVSGGAAPGSDAMQTRDGALVGTVGYMSPEQARGQSVDVRADTWAFGCLLYEMLAGRPAFPGATMADITAGILHHEPDWTALPSNLDRSLVRCLRRCLEKDVPRRLRDMGEAIAFLDEVREHPSRLAAGGMHFGSAKLRGVWFTVAAIAVMGLGAFAWSRGRDASVVPALDATQPLTFDGGVATTPSLSADGRLLAYASNRLAGGNLDIYVQQTSGGTAIRITDDPADDFQVDVSPDGSLVAFRSERTPRGVYLAPALGGTARLVAVDGRLPRFSPDGRAIAFETGPPLAPEAVGQEHQVFMVPTAGGTPVRFAANLINALGPIWSPDGASLLVLGRKGQTGADTALDWWWVPKRGDMGAEPTGVFTTLAAQHFHLGPDLRVPYPGVWRTDGVLFAGTTGAGDTSDLWWLPVGEHGRPRAAATRLTQGTTLDTPGSLSGTGNLVWSALTQVQTQLALPLDANRAKVTGPLVRLREDRAPSGRSAISRDGRFLVFPRYDGSSGALWVRDLISRQERELVATSRTPLNPVLSNDARSVAYTVTGVQAGGDSGTGTVFVAALGAGISRQICEHCEAWAFLPDGWLVVADDGRHHMTRLNLATGERQPLLTGQSEIDRPLFADTGDWVIFNTQKKVVRAPVHAGAETPASEWTTLMELEPTERTVGLSPNGTVLYVLLRSDGFRCLYGMRIDSRTGLALGRPLPVAHIHDATLRWGSTGYGNSVARGMFVMDLYETRGNIWMSHVSGRPQ